MTPDEEVWSTRIPSPYWLPPITTNTSVATATKSVTLPNSQSDTVSYPESVERMISDPKAPTAPLVDFLNAYAQDDNVWWRIDCGHHLNLFDAAIEALGEALEDGDSEQHQ